MSRCYHPIPAAQSAPGAPVELNPPLGYATMQLPCGRCLGCRTSRALEWARRCTHEAGCWDHNAFVTLTYSDAAVPADGGLVVGDLQRFLKRLRQVYAREPDRVLHDRSAGLRYFACGEYGERNGRPHYHLLLFNFGVADFVAKGKDLYESPLLSSLWKFGIHRLGAVSGASANYVAQYTVKKAGSCDVDTDGVVRRPPFLVMSRRPPIGARWLDEFHEDLRDGYLVVDGSRTRIPRSYRVRLRESDPGLSGAIDVACAAHLKVYDPARVEAEEVIHRRRLQLVAGRSL